MNSFINIKIVVLLLTGILFQRCATAYKPIYPDRLLLWDQQYIDPDSTVTIEIVNHILGSNDFNKFVQAEKINFVHMVALKIHNHGTRELHLPDDLEICLDNGYSIVPMTKEESMSTLTTEFDINEANTEIDLNESIVKSVWNAGRTAPLLISSVKFNKNMKDYYIESWIVSPGEEVAGFLLLPIPGNKPFQVCLR